MSALDVLAAAALVDNMSVDEVAPGLATAESAEGTSTDPEPPSTLEEARSEWGRQSQQQPGDEARRAGPSDIMNSKEQPSVSRSSKVSTSPEVVTVDSSSELLEPPAVDTFKEWVKAMLTDASGHRIDLPGLESTFKSTKGLLVNAKQAIFELFGVKTFKAAVCFSPERSDLKISQEEALGWLLAYARGRKLLVEEARPIGKLAGTLATEAKKQLDAIRDAAKVQRSRARKKDASAEELMRSLMAIDTKVAAERAKITEAPCEIKHMPAANTTIVEPRKPRPSEVSAEQRALTRRLLTSEVAAKAVGAALVYEKALATNEQHALMDLDPGFDEEEVAHRKLSYEHALRRLHQEFPQLFRGEASEDLIRTMVAGVPASVDMTSHPCPCGQGRLPGVPWMLMRSSLGFCESYQCGMVMIGKRSEIVEAGAPNLACW